MVYHNVNAAKCGEKQQRHRGRRGEIASAKLGELREYIFTDADSKDKLYHFEEKLIQS